MNEEMEIRIAGAKHINDWHIQNMQLIYDDYDSKVNDRCYEVGRMY